MDKKKVMQIGFLGIITLAFFVFMLSGGSNDVDTPYVDKIMAEEGAEFHERMFVYTLDMQNRMFVTTKLCVIDTNSSFGDENACYDSVDSPMIGEEGKGIFSIH